MYPNQQYSNAPVPSLGRMDENKLSSVEKQIKALSFRQYKIPGQAWSGKIPNNVTPVVFKKTRGQKAKGVDIQMTVDILSNVYQDNVDVVYLVSGDGDYLPVIEEVIRKGKQVYLAALSDGLNQKLVNRVDQFIDLDTYYFTMQSTQDEA